MLENSSHAPRFPKLKDFGLEFDNHLRRFFAADEKVTPRLHDAVLYSALGFGKRIRPFLVVQCCHAVGGTREEALPPAVAVECVHAFSLVHDDLPAMDNDDFRRGRPTTHKAFDEATAILAGDALIAMAFEVLSVHVADAQRAVAMMRELAIGAGWMGIIGGQAADLEGQDRPASLERTRFIHDRKTASLFRAGCKMGAIAGGASPEQIDRLDDFGARAGLAFQIADDLLDVTASERELGKGVGKDLKAGKQTYPACVGIESSQREARDLSEQAIGLLDPFGPAADGLRELARYAVARNY